jgi:hypothetical protein
MTLSLDLLIKIALPADKFKKWFEEYCPYATEKSPASAAMECVRCKHNINPKSFGKRCEVLNRRAEYEEHERKNS